MKILKMWKVPLVIPSPHNEEKQMIEVVLFYSVAITLKEGTERTIVLEKGRRGKYSVYYNLISVYFVPNHETGTLHDNSHRNLTAAAPPKQFSLFPSHSRGNAGSERLGNFPGATQLKVTEQEFKHSSFWLRSSCSYTATYSERFSEKTKMPRLMH